MFCVFSCRFPERPEEDEFYKKFQAAALSAAHLKILKKECGAEYSVSLVRSIDGMRPLIEHLGQKIDEANICFYKAAMTTALQCLHTLNSICLPPPYSHFQLRA